MRHGKTAHNDWKQRFRAPQALTSAVAWSAPSYGIVAINLSGAYQLYCWDVPTGHLVQRTHKSEGVVQGALAPGGQFIYYFDDHQGREIGHFVRVPYTGHSVDDEATDITPNLPRYSLPSSPGALAMSRSGNRLALVAAHNDAFHLYAIDVQADGTLLAPRAIWQSTRDILSPVVTFSGDIAVVATDERTGSGEFDLRAFDLEHGDQIAELSDGPESSLESIAFCPTTGDYRLAAVTNRTGIETLFLWDPVSGERTELAWPDLVGATRAFGWSPDGSRILLRCLAQARQQLYTCDVATKTLTRLAHPSGTFRNAYFGTGEEIFVHHSDATHPTELVALDASDGSLRRKLVSAGAVAEGHAWRSITFASSDGQPIQGWLAVPKGRGPFPTVIEAHGGPFTVQTDAFSPSSQAWVDDGFAYLTVNYRGSTTFGRAFQAQINGNPGLWEVEDLAAARDWVVKERIADPTRILLTGGSYGGYLTLQALGSKPDLWCGGMALSPITDWRQVYTEASDAMRVGIAAFLGGAPDEKRIQYEASSPITSVARVRAPVLIIQGRNDSRTPTGPVEEYVRQMHAAGKQIELQWYETGHLGGLLQVEEGIRHQELMLAFARRICKQPIRRLTGRRNSLSELLRYVGWARR
jgi:dipeptidyl aminopeptidase/acylaminoacyl peptidase